MAKVIKSDATLRAIKAPAEGRDVYRDQRVPGLQLQVTSRGVMTWYFVAKFRGRTERFNLGHFVRGDDGEGQLAAVRDQAKTLGDRLRKGIHPDAEKAAADARRRDTFAAVRDRFLAQYVANETKPRTQWAYGQALKSPRLAGWESRPVYEITRRDVIELLDRIAHEDGAPIMANRQLAYLRKFFGWCAEKDVLREGEPVPTDRVKPPQRREEPRKRTLSREELRVLWQVAGDTPYPFGPFVRLLVATGQRRDELLRAEHRDFDAKGKRWTQPDNKGGRIHIVPLHALALAEVETLPRFKECGLLFTTTGKAPVSGFSKYKARLDAKLAEYVAEHGPAGAFAEHWTLHDLRRSMTTHLREIGIAQDVCGRLLNHAPRGVTARVYDQHEMLPEKTRAMAAWGSLLSEITTKPAKNVLKLRRARK